MLCPNCGSEASVLLIDCSLPYGELRDKIRLCYTCCPIARSRFAGMHHLAIAKLSLEERNEAFAARRYVPDRRGTYPLEERVFDLVAGSVVVGIN